MSEQREQELRAAAQTLAARQAWPQLLAVFDELMVLRPSDPKAYYNRACVLCELGRHGEAQAALATALALSPDYELARQLLAKIEAAPATAEQVSPAVPPAPAAEPAPVSQPAPSADTAALPAPPPPPLPEAAPTLTAAEPVVFSLGEPDTPVAAKPAAPPVEPPALLESPDSLPTVDDFPIAEMNVKAGLAIWAMLSLLMLVFTQVRAGMGLPASLFALALVGAGYAAAVALTVHGAHTWITPASTNPVELRILRATEEAAAKAGLPTPRVALASDDDINAWTYGLSRRTAHIVVTTGFMEHVQPTDEELGAVLSHELGHVRYGDFIIATLMRFPLWLLDKIQMLMAIARAVAVGVLRITAELASGCGWIGLLILLGLLFFVLYMSVAIAVVGALIFVGVLFLNAFEREREYLADLYSAALQGTIAPLQSGLAKLEQAAERVRQEIERRAANAQEGEEVDTHVEAPGQAFASEEYVGSALAARPTLFDSLRTGEFLNSHPVTRHRVYYLQHPHHRHRVWSRLLASLEEVAAKRIGRQPGAEALDWRPVVWAGVGPGVMLAVLPVLSSHWAVQVAPWMSLAAGAYALGRIGQAQHWSPGTFVRQVVFAAFCTATVLLTLGGALLSELAVAFWAAFGVAVPIYGLGACLVMARSGAR